MLALDRKMVVVVATAVVVQYMSESPVLSAQVDTRLMVSAAVIINC